MAVLTGGYISQLKVLSVSSSEELGNCVQWIRVMGSGNIVTGLGTGTTQCSFYICLFVYHSREMRRKWASHKTKTTT